jgi:hypothetical protein
MGFAVLSSSETQAREKCVTDSQKPECALAAICERALFNITDFIWHI